MADEIDGGFGEVKKDKADAIIPPEYLKNPDAAFGLMAIALQDVLTGRKTNWKHDQQVLSLGRNITGNRTEISMRIAGDLKDLFSGFAVFYLQGARAKYDITPREGDDNNVVRGLTDDQVNKINSSPTFWGKKPFTQNMGVDPLRSMQVFGNIQSKRPLSWMVKFEEYVLATDPVVRSAVDRLERKLTDMSRTNSGIDTGTTTRNRQISEAHTILLSRVFDSDVGNASGQEMRERSFKIIQRNGLVRRDGAIDAERIKREYPDDQERQAIITMIRLVDPNNLEDLPAEFRNYCMKLIANDYEPALVSLPRVDGQSSEFEQKLYTDLGIYKDFESYRPSGSAQGEVANDDPESSIGTITPACKPTRGNRAPRNLGERPDGIPTAFDDFINGLNFDNPSDNETSKD